MKMLSFLENINSTYGGPAFSLPALLHTLNMKENVKCDLISLKKENEEYDNKTAQTLGVEPIFLRQSGVDKLKFTFDGMKVEELTKGYDVFHTNNLWNYFSFLPYQVADKYNFPNIISVRGALYPWSLAQSKFLKKTSWAFFQKKALEKAAFIHVTCPEEELAVRALGIKNRIVISQHGVEVPNLLDDIPDAFSQKYGLQSKKKYFLFMSRLHSKKGLDKLLNIWSDLSQKYPDWVLLVAGPDYGGYVPKIKSLKNNAIKYMGMLEGIDKEYCFAIASFFVLPSYSENFGVVIGEAMARALPVLTTTNTPWEIINQNDAGVCFELTEENLARELECFFNMDEGILREMGMNARRIIKDYYSWEKVSHPFYEALKSL